MNQKNITDLTIEDLKAVITEVVVTQLQQWFGKPNLSVATVKPEPTISTNQPYINAEGIYIANKDTRRSCCKVKGIERSF